MQGASMRISCSQHQGNFILNLLKNNILTYCLESNRMINLEISMSLCVDNY